MSRAELNGFLRAHTPPPLGTRAIVIAYLAVYAAMALASGTLVTFPLPALVSWGGLSPAHVTHGEWWRLLTATFVHAHLLHLAGNLLGLLVVAPTLERLIGTGAFVALFVACGVSGSAASLAAHAYDVSVGASGAIMGAYGMLLASMLRLRGGAAIERDGTALRGDVLTGVHLRSTIGFVLLTVLGGWWLPHVDNAAHLGGLAAGLAVGWVASAQIAGGSRRPRRTAAAVTLAVLTAMVIAAGAEPVMDFQAEVISVFTVESSTRDAYARAVAERRSAAELATLIESRVMPAIAGRRERLATAGVVARERAPALQQLRLFVVTRERAWRLRAEGHRASDAAALHQADALDREADLLVRGLLQLR